MSGWAEYALAWALFLASHSLPARPALRARLVGVLGRRAYLWLYSVLSLALLLWLFRAAGRAPFVALWDMLPGGPWIVLVAIAVALGILSLALFQPNPLSFGGTAGPFDPARPGILRWVRHPVLAAALIWSLAHLTVNGDLAHVILFGGFASFAALGMWALDRRNRRRLGPQFQATLEAMRQAPVALPDRPALRLAVAALAVAGLFLIHPWLAGVEIAHWFH